MPAQKLLPGGFPLTLRCREHKGKTTWREFPSPASGCDRGGGLIHSPDPAGFDEIPNTLSKPLLFLITPVSSGSVGLLSASGAGKTVLFPDFHCWSVATTGLFLQGIATGNRGGEVKRYASLEISLLCVAGDTWKRSRMHVIL
jgi:hypothetical protein